MEVYVYQSSALVSKFYSHYLEAHEGVSALPISEPEAEEGHVKLVSHLINLIENSAEDKFSDDLSRILFSLDLYFIQIFKYSHEDNEFFSFWCVHKDLFDEGIPEKLIIVDGGGVKYWCMNYNITKSMFSPLRVNSPW